MTGPATLTDLRKFMQAKIRKIGQGFREPDDDWAMVLVVQTPAGIEPVALAPDMFRDGRTKDLLAEYLRRLVVAKGAYRYAVLYNAHGIALPDEAEARETVERIRNEEVRVEQLEGAQEVLWLTVGDAETEEFWSAPILRDARYVRKLGKWENVSAEFDGIAGRFVGLNAYLG